jgi:hypothetical protein
MTPSIPSLFLALVSTSVTIHAAAEVTSTPIGKTELVRERIAVSGQLVAAMHVQDTVGVHILVLSSVSGPSHQRASSGRIERIDLRASYYRRAGGAWTEEWNIKDGVDCPGLDSEAAFFAKHVTITDLNKDGIAEVTVPYKMFCGGGVDSDTIKLIMRQGKEKYALRGESLVRLPGQEDFGGTYKADAALALPRNAAYQKHLVAVWKQVYIRPYP